MKKSTLITTIAMIVVVVVALSTATYAWFSSSSVSVAQVEMSTQASAEWMIFQGAEGTPDSGKYVFTTAASDVITLTPNALASGLHSPLSDYTHTISVTGTTAAVTAQKFVEATVSGTTTETVKTSGPAAVAKPYVLKVSNATGADDKILLVSVIINAGPSQTVGTLYAAAATKTDISYITTKSGATVKKATSGYNKATEAATAVNAANIIITPGSPVAAIEAKDGGFTTKPAFEYKDATAMSGSKYSNFNLAGADDPARGIAANDYYLEYSFEIADMDKTDSVYLSIYSWIDGWEADTSASRAEYKIVYAFTTKNA